MMLPKDDEDYPLPLLVAIKEALFCVCGDPQLDDARTVLSRVDAFLQRPLGDAGQPEAPSTRNKAET